VDTFLIASRHQRDCPGRKSLASKALLAKTSVILPFVMEIVTDSSLRPELDATDRRLLHALGINGRASFRLIASVIGTSEQTAARRYRRLRDRGVLRVLLLPAPDPADRGQLVRLEVQPQAVRVVVEALARRPDVSWLRLMNAGAEILFGVRARTSADRDALLLDQLPRTGRVLRTTVYSVLHQFRTEGEADWCGFPDQLDAEQRRRLHVEVPDRASMRAGAADQAMLEALAVDGRASYAQLAQVSGVSESAAARRLEVLVNSGALYGDVDIAPEQLGFPAGATLYLEVTPSRVPAVGKLVAALSQTAFVAAVGGRVNMIAAIRCRDVTEIYEYVTVTLGRVSGVEHVEVSTVSRTIKHARLVTDEKRPNATARRG
jgi:DNA-binding Lrp family transcriptional regulator